MPVYPLSASVANYIAKFSSTGRSCNNNSNNFNSSCHSRRSRSSIKQQDSSSSTFSWPGLGGTCNAKCRTEVRKAQRACNGTGRGRAVCGGYGKYGAIQPQRGWAHLPLLCMVSRLWQQIAISNFSIFNLGSAGGQQRQRHMQSTENGKSKAEKQRTVDSEQ